MISLALVVAMTVASDGGVDAPVASQGVHEVVRAELPDGGVLGEGWHLTRDRMQKVGARLVVLENELKQAQQERDTAQAQQPAVPTSFWVGVAVGAAVTGAAVVAIARAVK